MIAPKRQISLHGFLTRLILLCVGRLVVLSAYLAINRVRVVQNERDQEATKLARSLAIAVDQDLSARILGRIGMMHSAGLRWSGCATVCGQSSGRCGCGT